MRRNEILAPRWIDVAECVVSKAMAGIVAL
jgi:hypothetical protein